MIKKILFTILVAVGVVFFYKIKNAAKSSGSKSSSQDNSLHSDDEDELPERRISTQLMAYVIVGFLVLFSSVFFGLSWMDDRTMITVRIINSQNNITEYQIQKNQLKGRSFTTIDGRMIELGDNERLEILPQQN